MTNNQRASRKSEPFDSLPGPVQEAINAHAKYYAEHHGLGMSLRDDLTYIAQVALRWAPKPTPSDGGLDLAQELRTVLSWEGKRMGAMSAGVLRQVIGRIEKASERSETGPSAEQYRQAVEKTFQLRLALQQCVAVTEMWHGKEAFDLYFNHSPEMKLIRDALGKMQDPSDAPSESGG